MDEGVIFSLSINKNIIIYQNFDLTIAFFFKWYIILITVIITNIIIRGGYVYASIWKSISG